MCPEWSEGPATFGAGAPRLGQDNEDILEELGYSSADIEKLYAEGVIGARLAGCMRGAPQGVVLPQS